MWTAELPNDLSALRHLHHVCITRDTLHPTSVPVPDSLPLLLEALPGGIRSLDFHSISAPLTDLQWMPRFASLTQLSLSVNLDAVSLQPLQAIKQLQSLHLHFTGAISGVAAVGRLSQLTALSLSSYGRLALNLDFCRDICQLQSLDLTAYGGHCSCSALSHSTSLVSLMVSFKREDVAGLVAVMGLTHLTQLSLELPFETRAAQLPGLSQLTGLQELWILEATDWQDARQLSALTAVTKLGLGGIHQQVLREVAPMHWLKVLTIKRSYELCELPDLAQLTSLTRLTLSECRVTAFTPLQSLCALQCLQVHFYDPYDAPAAIRKSLLVPMGFLGRLVTLDIIEVAFLSLADFNNLNELRELTLSNIAELSFHQCSLHWSRFWHVRLENVTVKVTGLTAIKQLKQSCSAEITGLQWKHDAALY